MLYHNKERLFYSGTSFDYRYANRFTVLCDECSMVKDIWFVMKETLTHEVRVSKCL